MKKVIIVTGDSSGLGRDLCTLLNKDENIIYGISRRQVNVSYPRYRIDVLEYDQIVEAINEIYNKEGRIDIVICSAGLGVAGAIETMSNDEINYQMDVNFNGVVNVNKAVLPILRKQGFGKIVNISSLAAIAPMPFQAFYSASKAAINTYSMALANELRPYNVKVLSLMPGDTKTDFTSHRRKVIDIEKLYGDRVDRNVKKMELDEINGTPSIDVAKQMVKIINKKNPKVLYTIGFNNKLVAFLMKILPSRLVNKVLYNIYAK